MTPMNLTRPITSGYIAHELDWRRFRKLHTVYLSCPRLASCNDLCEFIAVTNALGNVDSNIWLIDMTEQEMRQRIRAVRLLSRDRILAFKDIVMQLKTQFWERGLKERVLQVSRREITQNRRFFPSVWRDMIDEKNALMAVRLA